MTKHVKCLEVRSFGLYPIIPASEPQNIYATYILNTFPIPRYPRSLTGHNVHSVSIARMLIIKIREMDGCAREYRSETFMRRALTCLTYKLDRSPFSETFVSPKSDTSANVNEPTNTLNTFTNPYEATDTFTNANETKDLLDIEGETRVIRFWRNRMIKLGLGIEDDADELLDNKGDTAVVPADESDATRMEDVDNQMKRY
ncbi:hypothetical protein GJ496_002851 [Pomphorhynchus laevis]|nr:hypothetical protein GJ496_002851 [Pomphorhynchus laevis]